MLRKTAFAALAAAALFAAVPAYAGPAETAYLQKLTNSWSGKGTLRGADTGTITCRVDLKAGSQNVKYQGRCTIPDMAGQAFNGSITYNDKAKRYESRTSSGVTAGVRRGDKLIFTTSSKSLAGSSFTTMTISPSQFIIDFALVDGKTGEKTTSRIVFSK